MSTQLTPALPDEIFKIIFEKSPGSLLVKADTPYFTILAASDAYLAITNATRELIIGKSFFQVFPDDDNDPRDETGIRKIFNKVVQTGQKLDIPSYRYDTRDPETGNYKVRYWSCSNVPFNCNDGKVNYILNTIVEITGEVNAKQAAIESENRFRMAAEATGFATFDWDFTDQIRLCPPPLVQLFGHPAHTFLPSGDAFRNQILPEDQQVVLDAFKVSLTTGIYAYDVRVAWPDGSIHWLSIKGKLVVDIGQKPVRILGTVIDITESKRDEIRKNDFIAMASHELKTPLTSIKSHIQILSKKLAPGNDAFVNNALAKANNQVNKMTDLIHGFLDLSKLESGKLQLKPELFDINRLIADCITELTQSPLSHMVAFDGGTILNVTADREKISQVINNFLSNAVKYSTKGSNIIVKSVLADGNVEVAITDEGVGIKPKDHKKIFQRFYRVDNDKIRNVSGFGIGLYLSSEIIQCHNGKIWVESDETVGSTFYFSLPTS
ncbi:PAS domain-containing sensor histidine kinase [Mucilaginibacter sp. FT3.2]|uniref:PAS domain-containing sensor histidine kinase n=1 Tax=Mucilaginibacter sp. FT3.2 TaxID=2723090 RepID=UPI00161F8A8E|nr:ATP-binding protein [Mucilaginibacter sp. FT3.2]MBB6234357.1 two-component system CheB/CheR fusion protein [Mucilaginibacter sp. FT3.2]